MRRHKGPSGRYRPEHAWLGRPGDGVPLRPHRGGGRWRFRWAQLRVVLVAALLGALAWSQLVGIPIARLLRGG